MANVEITLKRNNSGTYDELYPTTNWAQINDKPSTYTPTAHTHVVADITDLAETLQTVHIYAKADSAITKGQAIQFVSAQGDHITVKPAVPADVNANSSIFVGIAETDLAVGAFGYIMLQGQLTGFNTSTYSLGTILWFASAGSTAGVLTSTKPNNGYAKIQAAAVTKVGNSSAGIIQIRVTDYTTVVSDIIATGTPSSSTYLRGDGTWATPSDNDTNTTYTFATGTTNGTFNVTPSGGSLQAVPIYGLGTAAYTASTAYAASSHAHGSITSTGTITSNTALGSGDRLVFVDTSTGNGVQASSITIGTSATSYFCNDGTWRTPLLYSVLTADKYVYNATYIDTGLSLSLDANSYYQVTLAGAWGRITTATASALRVSIVSAAAAGSSGHYGAFEFGALDTSTSLTGDVVQGLFSTTSGGTYNSMSTASATTLVVGSPLLGSFSVYTGASAVTMKLTLSASVTTADGVYIVKGTSLTAIKVG